MNNELMQTQSVGGTDNPQGSQSSPPANESVQFQNSANTEVLNQNRPIEVVSTGDKVQSAGNKLAASTSGDAMPILIFTIIAGFVVVLVAVTAYYRRIVASQLLVAESVVVPEVKTPVKKAKAKTTKAKAPKGKKKQPRSKRRK